MNFTGGMESLEAILVCCSSFELSEMRSKLGEPEMESAIESDCKQFCISRKQWLQVLGSAECEVAIIEKGNL